MEQPTDSNSDFKTPDLLPALIPRRLAISPQAVREASGESDFKNGRGPGVYQAIVKHQRDADWWANHDDLEMLRDAVSPFIKEFNLRVKDAVYMSVPLIRIERMNVRTMGAYRAEADGYAITGTIALNEERLRSLPDFMKLAVLTKMILCAWRHQSGGKGDFDRQCRERMKAMGLVINEKGAITIEKGGPFHRLLQKRGIDVPVASVLPKPARKGKTTLQLWSCTCQKCRVGTKEFFALCPMCSEPFRLGDHVGKRFVKTGDPASEIALA